VPQSAAGRLPPICILAGGLGTRLGTHAQQTPKALIDIAGEPFLDHQLRLLARHGALEVVLCVGYLGAQIVETIGNERFGLRISYSHDGARSLGTLGAIRRAAPLLGERFLILYGDTYLRLDYRAAAEAWSRSGLPAMMTVLRNEGRWDISNTHFDGERIVAYDKHAPEPEMDWIDYGLGGIGPETLGSVGSEMTDLADLYHELAARGQLFGFAASERFFEIGTPAALVETRAFLSGEAGEAVQCPRKPTA